MKAGEFFRVVKGEITLLVVLVAVSGFLSNPVAFSRIWYLLPLVVSGALGSFSASILNNVYDMDIDSLMKRTSYRKNLLTETNRTMYVGIALLFLATSISLSAIIINPLTAAMIFLGFLSYFLLYTVVLKRRTTWNIVIGGIAGSFPALAGWAAVTNNISYTSIFIALLVFMWTPTHFWALASYRTEDYRRAEVPMLPAVVGVKKGFQWLAINTVILVVYSLLPLFFTQIHVGIVYYAVAIAADIYLLYRILVILRGSYESRDFRKAFSYSNTYLLFLLVSIWFVII